MYGAYTFGESSPGSKMVRLQFDDVTVYDARDTANVIKAEGLEFRYYDGSPDQPADPIMVDGVGTSPGLGDDAQAYRHLTTLWIDGWDIAQSGGRVPLTVRAEIWENATETTSTVNYPPMGADLAQAVDFDGGKAWLISGSGASPTLRQLDLKTNTLERSIVLDWSGRMHSDNHLFYAPWLDALIGGGPSVLSGQPELFVMDHVSGALLAVSSGLHETGSISYNDLVPVRVRTPLNTVETYVVFSEFFYKTLRVAQYTGSGFVEVGLESGLPFFSAGDVITIAAGPELPGKSIVYAATGVDRDNIQEIEISAGGGVSRSDVYTTSAAVERLYYDSTDGGLVIQTADNLIEKRRALDSSFDEMWSGTDTNNDNLITHYNNRVQGQLPAYFVGNSTIRLLDLKDGTFTTAAFLSFGAGNVGFAWDGLTNSVMSFNDGVSRVFLSDLTSSQILLRADLEARALEDGRDAADIDFSEVTELVDFGVNMENVPFRTLLLDVARVFGYLVVESDKIYLKALPSDGTPTTDATLQRHDLAEVLNGEAASGIRITDRAEGEVVSRVEITYIDSTHLDYTWTTHVYTPPRFPKARITQANTLRLRIPYGVDPSLVASLAAKLAHRENVARVTVEFNTGLRHLNIEPGSVVSVTGASGRTHLVRVDSGQTFDLAGGQIVNNARSYLSSHALSYVGDPGQQTQSRVIGPNDSIVYPLLLPLIDRAAELEGNGLGVYGLITHKGQASWNGGTGLWSTRNNVWVTFGFQAVVPTIGSVISPLGDTETPHASDYDNSLRIALRTGDSSDLTSVTELQRLNGEGQAIAVGKNGRWEIVTPETWVDNGNGTHTATRFSRAQFGTEPFTGTHQAGDLLVVLKPEYLHFIQFPVSQLDKPVLFTALGIGQSFGSGIIKSEVIDGTAETPYMVAQFTGSYDGVTGLDLDWYRQTRGDGAWVDDTAGVPLFQNAELYEVDVLDGPGGNVLATRGADGSITSTSHNISVADLTTIFGTIPATITCTVYQMSDIGTRGYGREVTIDT